MPKGVALDKHGRAFQQGETVIGPYGSATVVQIDSPKVVNGNRRMWLHNSRKGNHRVWTTDVVKI